MHRRIRAHDWTATALGPRERWPARLSELLPTVLAASVPMAIFWGPRFIQLYNDAYARLLGDAHPQALGSEAHLTYARDWSLLGPGLERVRATGEAVPPIELPLFPEAQRGIGPSRGFRISPSPIAGDAPGAAEGVLVVCDAVDPDALQLQASEELFRLTFSQAAVGMAITTPQGSWLAVNERYPALFGYTADELGERNVFSLTNSDGERESRREIDLLLEGEVARIFTEKRYRHASGATVWGATQVSLIRDDLGQPMYLFWVIEDVTERRRATERARRMQSVTSALAKGVGARQVAEILLAEGIASLGANAGWVVRAIEGSEGIEIIAEKNAPAALFTMMEHPGDSDRLPTPYALRTGNSLFLSGSELAERFPELEPIAERANVSALIAVPLELEDRVVAALGLTFPDARQLLPEDRDFIRSVATQCAQAIERALLFDREKRRAEEFENAVRARDEFLSIASHELKTPLTPLRMRVQALSRFAPKMIADHEAEDWLQKQLASIENYGDRLSRLVDELLDVSRIVGGRLRMELERVDLAEVVREVVEGLERRGDVERSRCTIQVDARQEVVGHWDRLRLEQVATNLITNALKYGAGHPVELRVEGDGAFGRLVISDRGIGIAPEAQERIFGRFERAVSTRHFGGFGLGLYIAREIVDALGGRIEVQSVPGAGATFTVSLPVEGPPLEAGEKAERT